MASSAMGDKNWMKKGKLALNSEKHNLLNIIYEEVKHFFYFRKHNDNVYVFQYNAEKWSIQ